MNLSLGTNKCPSRGPNTTPKDNCVKKFRSELKKIYESSILKSNMTYFRCIYHGKPPLKAEVSVPQLLTDRAESNSSSPLKETLPVENLGISSQDQLPANIYRFQDDAGLRIVGRKGSILFPDNRLLADSALRYSTRNSYSGKLIKATPVEEKNPVFIAASVTIGNYYHWIVQSMSRLYLANQMIDHDAHRFRDMKIYIAVGNFSRRKTPAFQTELIDKACEQLPHIRRENIIYFKDNTYIQTTNDVWFPKVEEFEYTGFQSCEMTMNYDLPARFLRDLHPEIAQNHEQAPVTRLYITRKYAARSLINENELLGRLEAFNFKVLALETLSTENQYREFSQAQLILGPHGAGFTNILMAHPRATLIELMPPTHEADCFEKMAKFLRINYRKIAGKSTPRDAILRKTPLQSSIRFFLSTPRRFDLYSHKFTVDPVEVARQVELALLSLKRHD